MSGYGSPPTTPMPAAPSRAANRDLPQLIGYAAGLLGVLSFIWGFLTWFTQGGQGVAGYSVYGSGAGAVIGLSIAAGAIAAADAVEKKKVGVIPPALALAAFLVSLGLLIGKSVPGVRIGVGVGLILALITTIVQAAALIYLWLLATGRMRSPQPRPAAGGWQGQQQDPYRAGPSAPPPGQFPPQSPPGGYAPPAQPQYPPPSYGQDYPSRPPEPPAPGYGAPGSSGAHAAETGTPPGTYPGTQPGSQPPAPSSGPEEHPGPQWSPQTSYPGSPREPERPESEGGSANP